MIGEGSSESSTRKRSRTDFESSAGTSSALNDSQANGSDGRYLIPVLGFFVADRSLDTSSEDDIGPALPSSAPKKKRRKLPYEKLYINALPSSQRYSKSLMHKDQLSFLTITPYTDFLITSSVDGVVKFWKKVAVGIQAVKEFKAHLGEIKSVSVSQDGRSYGTAGADKTIKIFDVITFGKSWQGPDFKARAVS